MTTQKFMTPEDMLIQELKAKNDVLVKALQQIAKKAKTMDECYNGDRLRLIAREALEKVKK